MKRILKNAFRHLKHNRLNAAINVAGLATAITCVLLALLYWNDEHSFDRRGKQYIDLKIAKKMGKYFHTFAM